MKVIYGIGRISPAFERGVLVIGVFDGVHAGHQALIRRAVKRAKVLNKKIFVMTFDPHPVQVLHPKHYLPLIIPLSYRLKLIKNLGVDGCCVAKFTKKFASLSPETFIQKYIKGFLSPQEIFVGDDFRFGKDRQGTLEVFAEFGEKYGFKVNAVNAVKGGEKKIGSTQIRGLIAEGDLKKASQLLGRPVSFAGVVKKGDGRGLKMGFPTANLYPENAVLPPQGVYAVRGKVEGRIYNGMSNIGFRPSFYSPKKSINIETHLFNLHRKIYGKEIIIEFIAKIRNERKFSSPDDLIRQLKKDALKTFSLLTSSGQSSS